MSDLSIDALKPQQPFIEMKGVTHDYGKIRALDEVDFWILPGEIVGLVGDNGAGKSTLIKVLAGILRPTKGDIFIEGQRTDFISPRAAMECGIETIHQGKNLIDVMDIMRNIFFGRELTYQCMGFMKAKEMRVGKLSGGQKQAVAIARAMYFKNKILLLDEPTSALSVRETQAFLNHVVDLRDHGMSAVIVTHNLHHAYRIADRFVILSHGKKLADTAKGETSIDELMKLILSN
jgi:simple sugar transport system ATP-binding protein